MRARQGGVGWGGSALAIFIIPHLHCLPIYLLVMLSRLSLFNNVLFSVLHIIIITPSILYSMKKGRYIVPFFIEKSSDHQSGRMQTFPLFSTAFVHAYAFKGGTIYVINVHPFAEMW